MPNIGDICRGDKLEKKKYQWYMWSACKVCGRERWVVMDRKTDRVASCSICRQCASKSVERNEKIRFL